MNKVNAQHLDGFQKTNRHMVQMGVLGLVLVSMMLLGGCETEDCVNCIELPPPVVPTGVHSISGDNEIIVKWYDISYFPYDGTFNDNVASYLIYSRYYTEGDDEIPNREFFYIGEVAWNENFNIDTGLHSFIDTEAVNGERYEYAVAAVNSAGRESALSYEFVIDAPLPHSLAPVRLYNHASAPQWSAFDFSEMDFGRDQQQPNFNADIEIHYQGAVPYVHTARGGVYLQDFGVFIDNSGELIFEGVSWAPAEGYSSTGVIELIPGHIYVVELDDYPHGIHYAKFGVPGIETNYVEIVWAYQTIAGLPELSVPEDDGNNVSTPEIISL